MSPLRESLRAVIDGWYVDGALRFGATLSGDDEETNRARPVAVDPRERHGFDEFPPAAGIQPGYLTHIIAAVADVDSEQTG